MAAADTDWLARAIPAPAAGLAGLCAARLATAALLGRGGFALSSAAFADGSELDPSFTAEEEDAVAPPLQWSAPPANAAELVLVVESASARNAAAGAPTCHWLVWGLAPGAGQLLEGETPPMTGKNAAGNGEWLPPAPAAGQTEHYLFQLFALDAPLGLRPGASRAAVLDAMDGHVVALALLAARFTAADDEVDENDEAAETDRPLGDFAD